jgi:hypothetical protein
MYQTVTVHEFRSAFHNMGRGDQFSYKAITALFDYLEQYEEDTGEQIDLDVVALCCDYVELTEEEAREQYDIPEDEDWQEFLQSDTTVIPVDEDTVIIQQY